MHYKIISFPVLYHIWTVSDKYNISFILIKVPNVIDIFNFYKFSKAQTSPKIIYFIEVKVVVQKLKSRYIFSNHLDVSMKTIILIIIFIFLVLLLFTYLGQIKITMMKVTVSIFICLMVYTHAAF